MRRARNTAFTLYPEDIEIIERADTNDAGRSATIRRILREWDQLQRRMMVDRPGEYIVQRIGE